MSILEDGCWKMDVLHCWDVIPHISDPDEDKDRSFKAGRARAQTMILYLLKQFLENVGPLFPVYLVQFVISLVRQDSVKLLDMTGKGSVLTMQWWSKVDL